MQGSYTSLYAFSFIRHILYSSDTVLLPVSDHTGCELDQSIEYQFVEGAHRIKVSDMMAGCS